MKKLLQIFSVVIFSCFAVVLIGTVNKQEAKASNCTWINSGHIQCNSTNYYYSPPATQISYGDYQYAVFVGGDTVVYVSKNDFTHARIGGDSVYPTSTQVVTTPLTAGDQEKAKDNAPNEDCSINRPFDCNQVHEEGDNTAIKDGAYSGKYPKPTDAAVVAKLDAFKGAAAAVEDPTKPKPDCIKNPLSFFLCPLADIINSTYGTIIDGLVSVLQNPTLKTGTGITNALSSFITLANSFYILIFLFIILANFIAIPGLDNYSIKKMLPKFFAAVILTQFSFVICGAVLDIANIAGVLLPKLVLTAFGNTSATPGQAFVAAVNPLNGVVEAANFGDLAESLGKFLILQVTLIVGVVVGLIAFVYIAARYLFLAMLIVFSPLAFAAWVLPNTEKYFKQWWTYFIKLSIMFLLVNLLLAFGAVFSKIFADGFGSVQSTEVQTANFFGSIISIIVPIIVLALIPKTLKASGQVMSAAGKLASDTKLGQAGTGAAKGAVKKSSQEGKLAELKGTAFGAAGTAIGSKKLQATGATQKARAASAVADRYDKLSAAQLIPLAKAGDTNAEKAVRKKYKEKAIEAKQAFDAGIILNPTEQKAFNDLAKASGVTPPAGGGDDYYSEAVKGFKEEKEAKTGGASITTLQQTIQAGTHVTPAPAGSPAGTPPTKTLDPNAQKAQQVGSQRYTSEVGTLKAAHDATGQPVTNQQQRNEFNALAHIAAGNTDPHRPGVDPDHLHNLEATWSGPCWVAREVYGLNNPKWREFRQWMLYESPSWFRNTYLRHGENFAIWLKPHDYTKKTIKVFMDSRIKSSLRHKSIKHI